MSSQSRARTAKKAPARSTRKSTRTRAKKPPALPVAYRTKLGRLLMGKVEDALESDLAKVKGKVDLIFTSPPFPLNRKKKYGNLTGDDYVKWLAGLAPALTELLTPTGSIVIELGNAWEPGRPVMSLLSLKALLEFLERGELNLCQEFVCHNPARLPSPAQWVNVERIRVPYSNPLESREVAAERVAAMTSRSTSTDSRCWSTSERRPFRSDSVLSSSQIAGHIACIVAYYFPAERLRLG